MFLSLLRAKMPTYFALINLKHLLLFIAIAFVFNFTVLPLSAAEKEVNVYSYRQSFLLEPIFKKFTAKTGITVNLLSGSKGLVERIHAEGSKSPTDVLFTTNFSRLQDAVDADITAQLHDKKIESMLSPKFIDPSGNWFALTTRARIIYASKERVTKDEIKDYADLADAKWRGKICTRSGTHSYNLGLFASFIHHWGKAETEKWLQAVKKNLARKPQGNDRAQVKAIKEGLCDLAIGNSYYYGLMLNDAKQKSWAKTVNIIFPNQEKTGTHMNISGMALMKHAPNRENAIELMRFMLSEDIQKFYAEENFEYPVHPDVATPKNIAAWGEFTADNTKLIDIFNLRMQAFELVTKTRFNN